MAQLIRFPIERRRSGGPPRFLPTPFELWAQHRMICSWCHEGQTICRIGERLKDRWLVTASSK